jgi:hypothetical protein
VRATTEGGGAMTTPEFTFLDEMSAVLGRVEIVLDLIIDAEDEDARPLDKLSTLHVLLEEQVQKLRALVDAQTEE